MRSRFGCSTCRRRKIKCDEVKPICGPCAKAVRQCRFSASNFRTPFDTGTLFDGTNTWTDIPAQLTFINMDTSEAAAHPSQSPRTAPNSSRQDDVTLHEERGQLALPHRDDPNEASVGALHLMRYFKEGPGQWMDLFSTNGYFASKVLVLATSSSLLNTSICAFSAKCLGHAQQSHSRRDRTALVSSALGKNIDWPYQATKYYQDAIVQLKSALNSTPDGRTEEVLSAAVILSMCELMDSLCTPGEAHLSALSLFSLPASDMIAVPGPPVPQASITGPIFWRLARQDFLCAFVSETQMRLDLADTRLWQNAGIAAGHLGHVQSFDPSGTTITDNPAGIQEDARSDELVWLLGKIINHLTSGDALVPEDYARPPGQRFSLGLTQEELLERWYKLTNELQGWYDSLPSTFVPRATTRYRGQDEKFASFNLVWYDLPICAATMQSYHMARILLLVNQPQESTVVRSSISARLRSYRNCQHAALLHGREICGISLAHPTDGMRVHSVQPLFVAGQVFHQEEEQSAVIELLSSIERDLGWATEYYIAKLRDE